MTLLNATPGSSSSRRRDPAGAIPFLDLGASHDEVSEELALVWQRLQGTGPAGTAVLQAVHTTDDPDHPTGQRPLVERLRASLPA